MFKENFKELYNRELKSSIIKSLVYSLLVSLSILFVISLTFWILDIEEYWISLIAFAVSEIGAFFLFFYFFKPSDKSIATKLDSLGLAQRVITMYEYQDQDGLMARVQRQNAIDHINKVNFKLLKVVIPTIVIVFTCVAFVLGAASTTVAALSSHDIINNGKDTIEEIIPGEIFSFEVIYEVDGEGEIEGELFQVVYEGEDATPVNAVAMDGWAFVGWSDDFEDPYREDFDIHENLTITAIFMELDEQDQSSEGEGEGEPQEGEESESDEPQDLNSDGENSSPSEDPSDQEGGGAGGMYEPNNQVIDGETYYGDSTYDNAYGDAKDNLQSNSDLSDDVKEIIDNYYGNIEK